MKKELFDLIWRAILFDNGHGFILGRDLSAQNLYKTSQFVQKNGQPCCYHNNCHDDPQEAHQDFCQRAKDYQQKHGVCITRIYGQNIKAPAAL